MSGERAPRWILRMEHPLATTAEHVAGSTQSSSCGAISPTHDSSPGHQLSRSDFCLLSNCTVEVLSSKFLVGVAGGA